MVGKVSVGRRKMVSNVRARIEVGLLLGLTLSLLMWVSASPAQAETVRDCQAKIDVLRGQTENATFFGQNAERNRTGLVTKLDNASAKLAEGKNADAIQKLTNFRDTVAALNTQGKINPDDANTLISGANGVIACITALETQTPTAA
jgi:hypothetical protein